MMTSIITRRCRVLHLVLVGGRGPALSSTTGAEAAAAAAARPVSAVAGGGTRPPPSSARRRHRHRTEIGRHNLAGGDVRCGGNVVALSSSSRSRPRPEDDGGAVDRSRGGGGGTSSSTSARKYLETWVGGPMPSNSSSSSPSSSRPRVTSATSSPPLTVTGSSYLLPTLRLDRGTKPDSLSDRLDSILGDDDSTTTAPSSSSSLTHSRSMLTPFSSPSGGEECDEGGGVVRWAAPVILDLAAFRPDGSPHHVPITSDVLVGFVRVLSMRGIEVVGVTNPPPLSKGGGGTGEESVEDGLAGLPCVMMAPRGGGRGGFGGGRNGAAARMEIGMEEVLRLVKTAGRERWGGGGEVNKGQAPGPPTSGVDTPSTSSVFLRGHDEERTSLETPSTPVDTEADDEATEAEAVAAPASDDHVSPPPEMDSASPSPPPPLPARVFHGNVRTGQQVSAEGRSLVVIGSVHSGGEVLADGDIHVYGKLRGRALAGLSSGGEEGAGLGARVYANHFDPELVCIGTTFATMEGNRFENEAVGGGGGGDGDGGGATGAGPGPGSAMAWVDGETGQLRFQRLD